MGVRMTSLLRLLTKEEITMRELEAIYKAYGDEELDSVDEVIEVYRTGNNQYEAYFTIEKHKVCGTLLHVMTTITSIYATEYIEELDK